MNRFPHVLMLPPLPEVFKGRAKVVDADGLSIYHNGMTRSVRIDWIDAPEIGQKAKVKADSLTFDHGAWVMSLLAHFIGKRQVTIVFNGADKFDRVLGQVYSLGTDVGKWMVKSGLAIAIKDSPYYGEERQARENKIGMWGWHKFQDPRKFRKGVGWT